MADEVHLNIPDTTPTEDESLIANVGVARPFPITYQIPPVFTTGVGYMQASPTWDFASYFNIPTTLGGTFYAATNPFPVDGQIDNATGSFTPQAAGKGTWFLRCRVLEVDPGSREFFSNVVRVVVIGTAGSPETPTHRKGDYVPAE